MTDTASCNNCYGRGTVDVPSADGGHGYAFPCPECYGTGRVKKKGAKDERSRDERGSDDSAGG